MTRMLGIDYGVKRMGLAVSDPTATIATPLRTVPVAGKREALNAAREACLETESGRIVVGLPLNMDGSEGPMAAAARAFGERLAELAGVPVVCWDERLSTRLVERAMLEADMSRARRKKSRDKLAAQVILQSYLDASGLADEDI